MAEVEKAVSSNGNDSCPESPEPRSPHSTGEQDFILLSTPEIESDTGSVLSSGKSKSQGSSIGSFADVDTPKAEATIDKEFTDEEVKELVEDARKETKDDISDTSEKDCTNRYSKDSGIGQSSETLKLDDVVDSSNESSVLQNDELKRKRAATDMTNSKSIEIVDDTIDGSLRNRAGTDPGSGEEEGIDEDAVEFTKVTYLGSSTVDAPVSEIELKRTMTILREQSQVTIDVILVIGSTSEGKIRLMDPETKTDIATYKVQKILFCGRGDVDSEERDCFAFNTVHGEPDIFHCHVFKCLEPEMAGKIFKCFAVAFRKHRKHGQRVRSPTDTQPVLTTLNNLSFKFDVSLDIQEEDSKGYSSVSRDKVCFKLRQNVKKKVVVTVQQLTNRHLIVERCFGLLICPGRNVRHSDMHLLSGITTDIQDGGRVYCISGYWNPSAQDLLVLNTETPKDTRVFMTIAIDLVVAKVTDPVRFIYETKARIFPANERLWYLSRPRIHDTYIMDLQEAVNEDTGEKGYEVKSIVSEKELIARGQMFKRQSSYNQQTTNDKNSEDDEDDDEPLLSGSGMVQKECTEEELCSWSELLSKWKDVSTKPRQLYSLVKKGIPEPLRGQVWQMMAGVEENDDLLQNYRHLLKRESPTEQVIVWDIHRTYPAHEYFKEIGGEGQESLYKISKAYSVYDEEVGYCQGLSFFSAVLLLHMPEEQAFAVLVKMMSEYGMREIFKNEFQMLHLRFYQLERMIEDSMPDLFSHFQHNNVEAHMYASQWFLTLFTAKFPLPMVFWIIDVILCVGTDFVFQMAIALLKDARKDLLQMDFEGILKYFRVTMPKRYMEEERYKQLLASALNIKVTHKKLKKYEKEFVILKEKEAQLEDPVERLTRENKRLMETNMRLEGENDNLAHELVTTKVTLHNKLLEAEEEIDALKTQLQLNRKALTETEDERESLKTEGKQLKDMWRKSLQESEDERKRHTAIIEEYKKICSQLDERSQKLKDDLQQELVEIKRRIGECEKCAPLFSEEGQTSQEGGANDGFKTSVKVVDAEKRLRELELELAETKLTLVETECRAQELEHKLSSFIAAVAIEESKPWFKRKSVILDNK
ncbi:rab GTPase-activating protein 1-like isoform X2 [Actinia tenebrosa]|uniref:Rab GTPase-activating protein 1-like isoform X2 n=1 Tax=Actinia tenebrosa TaxID=6105 RepID=A0A6P8I032_ACTTE|nr:rab GTPase-activating protein 1-like isoform X2 [Actinia tenebrosa]